MARTRIHELDALRGFAVGGIMLVNTWQHAVNGVPADARNSLDWTMQAVFQGRFYPIFSLLFGISFVLFLDRAGRWRLLPRLFWLFWIGIVQHSFYEGEVLTDYAFYGLLVLLPASFLSSGPPVLILGLAVLGWALGQANSALLIIPGLFLIGMALMQMRPSPRLLWPGFAVSAVATALLTAAWEMTHAGLLYRLAALTGAAALTTGMLLLLRSRWSRPISAVLEPLGKMALTNYVTGTVVITLTGALLHADPTRLSVLAIAAVTLAAQAEAGRWWLARYRYGPLEWVWRCLTWFRPVPNRLESGRDHHRPLPDRGLS
ncbi:DUF418 domain-containing protein [Nonomuraea muscovyensis]|uniref:DUF418 domain-containing protein n=1 Tax=Nonomuraea muscovyensis TaxID=1124761 RepID=UPI0033FD4D63